MNSKIGKVYELKRTVEKSDLASFVGSGGQDVLATPIMIGWMEIASLLCLDINDEDVCSLGVKVDIEHIAPTPLGSEVTVRSTLIEADGRRFKFSVEAFDNTERIGYGTHIRATARLSKFIDRAYSKKPRNTDINMKGKNILTLLNNSPDEINHLIDFAIELKEKKKKGIFAKYLNNKNIALIFEKKSTRTRCAFVSASHDEGAHAEYLDINSIQLGEKESIEDTARVMGRMYDGIMFRGFKQETVDKLAEYSGIPVWNGLTDLHHPTQALADAMTIKEKFGKIKGVKVCYVGDGRNNVANSLMVICSKLGALYTCIAPNELLPDKEMLEKCSEFVKESGGKITVSSDISDARGTDVIYTDVWCSMGEEEKAKERVEILTPYRVDESLMKQASEDAVFLHCLPAVKGNEVTEGVFESHQSLVFDQAENRLHTIKAMMIATITGR